MDLQVAAFRRGKRAERWRNPGRWTCACRWWSRHDHRWSIGAGPWFEFTALDTIFPQPRDIPMDVIFTDKPDGAGASETFDEHKRLSAIRAMRPIRSGSCARCATHRCDYVGRNRFSVASAARFEGMLLVPIYEAVPQEVVMVGGEHVFYASSNGDVWSLVRADGADTINVKHQPNAPSGGKVSLTTLQNFLARHYGPQHDALIQLIRTMIGEMLDRKAVSEDT